MTTIYLIRHGQASFGAESYDKLSPNGELQAKLLGRYFDEILKEAPYVVAGSMQRHQQTAQLALAECFPESEPVTDSAWNEFNHQQVFAQYEPRFNQPELLKEDVSQHANPRAYLSKIFEGAIERWTGGDYHHEYEESWPDFKQRVETALQHLCDDLAEKKPRYAVVFTSGGVISVAAGKILGLSPNKTFALNWAITNTSMTTLRLVGNQPQLLSLNEHHYIKAQRPDLLTWI
ncbi:MULTISPECIES: histidine phosphatase family protein [Acinetobacter]|uniref:Histidine phosphatase family protein n=1 Tax=Acinetobacter pseudolwoffii TaxID=2053287 RepID=A0A2H9ULX8_9GAMM|nr:MULTISPECIES: histidine phosphatase family protein [Acinetobacter]NLZ86081.1 histidine phosphatase family protein [Gammaproteobacteria bacterium]MCO8090918.1 phosphoglycerate mutase family protein [Acinetobacter pseudolwoffii]MDH5819195.1 phosphoglycerate mutase family protein [Acinetobacter pseudolwoffii]MDM1323838.1 histidine phosphatase family protein [Acinetobacter pseudolwoffii]PJI32691.1 histidine phosphatase family protein [Acinetobacter pseudolwoffii]